MVGSAGRGARERQYPEEGGYRRGRRQPRGRGGCFFYVVVFLGVMLLLALIFGGFKKGDKYKGIQEPHPSIGVSVALPYPEATARTVWI